MRRWWNCFLNFRRNQKAYSWKARSGDISEIWNFSQDGYLRPRIIDNPELWWPRGHGEAFYTRIHGILHADGNILDEKKVSSSESGLQELVQEIDSIGKSFYFKINESLFLCKGGNYILRIYFYPELRILLLYLCKLQQPYRSNFNMVRVGEEACIRWNLL